MDETKVLTVAQFAKLKGLDAEYVRQMCRHQLDFRTGKPLHLPRGWVATKFGRAWMISKVVRRGRPRK